MAHPRAVSSYDSSELSVDGEAMYHVGHFLGGGHAGTVHECEYIATGQVCGMAPLLTAEMVDLPCDCLPQSAFLIFVWAGHAFSELTANALCRSAR